MTVTHFVTFYMVTWQDNLNFNCNGHIQTAQEKSVKMSFESIAR